MISKNSSKQIKFDLGWGDEHQIDPNNRWVVLAEIIPWHAFEDEYNKHLSTDCGANAVPFRTALGALIIQAIHGFTDSILIQQIIENPYMQYFIGKEVYSSEKPFCSSMMVNFRKRVNKDIIEKVNDVIIEYDNANKNNKKKLNFHRLKMMRNLKQMIIVEH